MSGRVIKMSFVSVLASALIFLCVMLPAASAAGAREGLILCSKIVIPSLFPFCVLAVFCFKSGIISMLARIAEPISKKIFHLSGEQFCVFLMSFLGGYPVGTKLIKALYKENKITAEQASRMMLYCINAGPAFILTAVGEGMLGSAYLGRVLLFGNMAATVIIAIIAEYKHRPSCTRFTAPTAKFSDAFVEATADASQALFSVCGWVVLFSAFLSLINCGILPKTITHCLNLILEVTTSALAADGRILLISAILSFCGLCVHCQVYSIAGEVSPPYIKFIIFRVLHASISTIITFLVIKANNNTVDTITNNIPTIRNNVSFSYASAAALVLLSILLIISVAERKNNKFV